MKIQIPHSLFTTNKLKEIYYKSFLLKDIEEKFFPATAEHPPSIETTKEIRLTELPWGCCRKSMIRLLGNPRYIIKRQEEISSEILFFKQLIQEEKCIIQCHFMKDQFYFAHADFISSLSTENKMLVQLLQEKYGKANFSTDRNFIIQDMEKNKIIVEQNVYLRLDYLCGKEAISKKIKQRAIHQVKFDICPLEATGRSLIEL